MWPSDADDQPADPQAAGGTEEPQQGAGAAGLAAEARGLHPSLYDDAEEAELRAAQGRQGAADQRLRGDRLYPGRGPQPAGALGGDDPRRAREGPSGRALPYPARRAGYPGGQEPQAAALEIRSKTTEVT